MTACCANHSCRALILFLPDMDLSYTVHPPLQADMRLFSADVADTMSLVHDAYYTCQRNPCHTLCTSFGAAFFGNSPTL